MTSQEFVYWLQGFLEVANPQTIDAKQLQVIKDHIALVLYKVTPNRNQEVEPYVSPFVTHPTIPGRWINSIPMEDLKCVQVTCDRGDKVSDALKATEMSHTIAIHTNGWNRNDDVFGHLRWGPEGSC